MRHWLARTAFGTALCLAVPGTATAGPGFWAWLEQLSGPGPFWGVGASLPILCYGTPLLEQKATWRIDWDCDGAKPDQPRVVLAVEGAFFTTNDNPLTYAPGAPSDRGVNLFMLLPALDLRIHRAFSVGTGFGFARFSGDAFDSLNRAVFQPVRLTVRPLSAFGGSRRWEALQVRLTGTTFIPGFDAADFGAVPGTFKAPYELQWSTGILVDFWKLLR